MLLRLFIVIIAVFSFSCKGAKKPCENGTPVAMFSDKTPGVSRHEFEAEGQNSFEKLRLDSIFELGDPEQGIKMYMPVELQIIQSGCEELIQEFRLEFFDAASPMPKNFPAPDCANIVAQVFGNLSKIDAKALAFAGLTEAMLEKQASIQYGAAVPLRDGFSIQMDKMHSSESTIVTIIFKKSAQKS